MDNPQGRILSVYQDDTPPHALVEVAASLRCARCASGKGCGAGLLAGDEKPRRVDALIGHDLQLGEGDRVAIQLSPNNLLRAAWIVYGLPLVSGVAGAVVAWLMGMGDVGASLAAFAGIGAGMLAGRRRLQQSECLRKFTPVVTAKIASVSD